MLATVAALLLACKPYHPPTPPQPVVAECEGADEVHRSVDGREVKRRVNACTFTRCVGPDRVRFTDNGHVVAREPDACTITRCEGASLVTRTVDGRVTLVLPDARGCVPVMVPIVVRPPQPRREDPLRFGLTAR